MVMNPLTILGFFIVALPAHAAQLFSDVPETREEFIAVEYLHRRGIIVGRPDGTFGPDDFVNRAEALTIVVRAVANAENLPPLSDCFPDVYGEEWYVRPICYAKDLHWVSGYPDGTFRPTKTVSKAEFIKVLLSAYGEDIEPFEALRFPLAHDVPDPKQWFYPFLAYGIASSMTRADAGENLRPGEALTRGQVALLSYRFLSYREGKRTQVLLSEAERDIRRVFDHLDGEAFAEAKYASGRAKIMVWGVLAHAPEDALAHATEILTDALGALVRAYELERAGASEEALEEAQRAFALAEEADRVSGEGTLYTLEIRNRAHLLAEDVRSAQEE